MRTVPTAESKDNISNILCGLFFCVLCCTAEVSIKTLFAAVIAH